MVSIQTFFSFPLENSADKSFLLCFQCSPSTPKRELPIEPPKFTLLLFVNTGKCLMKASFSHSGSMTISVGEVPSNVLPCKNKFKSRYISGQDMEYKWTIKNIINLCIRLPSIMLWHCCAFSFYSRATAADIQKYQTPPFCVGTTNSPTHPSHFDLKSKHLDYFAIIDTDPTNFPYFSLHIVSTLVRCCNKNKCYIYYTTKSRFSLVWFLRKVDKIQ